MPVLERFLSAPSKLFLSGEYAVLWGGTARLVAVGPRVEAAVRRRDDREVHLVLEEGRLVGWATPLGVRWSREVSPPFRFLSLAVDQALRVHGREALGFELALLPTPASPSGGKLGLGGSARASVLGVEAARFILDDRFDALKVALVAHALGQDPRGSGADVATIFAGGVVRYRRFDVESLLEARSTEQIRGALAGSEPVDLWKLPMTKLWLTYAFTDTSASTPKLVARVEAELPAERREAFVVQSEAFGQQLEDGLLRADLRGVRAACRGLQALLAGLRGLEIEEAKRILSLAEAYGAAGKISGAGAGDGCILFSASSQERAALLEGLSARGIHAFPLEVEPGLQGEPAVPERLGAYFQNS